MNVNQRSIYGEGLAFPPRVDENGRLAWARGEQNVRESVRLILMTEPGERVMREDFGCGLRQFLYEPNTVATRQLIRERIVRAISRWEPRVALEEVSVTADPSEPRLVAIAIHFRLVATQAAESIDLTLQLGS